MVLVLLAACAVPEGPLPDDTGTPTDPSWSVVYHWDGVGLGREAEIDPYPVYAGLPAIHTDTLYVGRGTADEDELDEVGRAKLGRWVRGEMSGDGAPDALTLDGADAFHFLVFPADETLRAGVYQLVAATDPTWDAYRSVETIDAELDVQVDGSEITIRATLDIFALAGTGGALTKPFVTEGAVVAAAAFGGWTVQASTTGTDACSPDLCTAELLLLPTADGAVAMAYRSVTHPWGSVGDTDLGGVAILEPIP